MKLAAALGMCLVAAGLPAAARADTIAARFSGLSVGVHAGAAWGRSSYGTNPNCPAVPTEAVFCNASPDPTFPNGTAVGASGSGTLLSRSLTGGVQAGYNWQAGRLVVGGEADFAAMRLDKTATADGFFPFLFLGNVYSVTNKTTVNWLSTLRARLGVTVTPQVLLYVTGGAAFARVEAFSSYADNAIDIGLGFPGGTGAASASAVKSGWTIGGGAQWALDSRWSVKAEYLYADLGSMSVAVPVTNTPAFMQTIFVSHDVSVHLARVGLDFRF